MRRSVESAIAVLLAALGAGCGDHSTDDAVDTRPADSAPLARWRRAAETMPEGTPIAIDALRACVARVSLWEDGRVTERERRDLAAGDVWRVLFLATKRDTKAALDPTPDDRAKGRVHPVVLTLSYSSQDHVGMPAFFSAFTKSDAPWTAISTAEPPPSSLDVPRTPLTMLAVGVAEPVTGPTPLRLDLSYPPRIAGPSGEEGSRRIAAWILEVLPP